MAHSKKRSRQNFKKLLSHTKPKKSYQPTNNQPT